MSTFKYDPTQSSFQDEAYEVYRRLRNDYPVYHNKEQGFWALSRFEDVRWAASSPELFSSENTSISMGLLPQIQQLDPPLHDQLRGLLSTVFTPRRVTSMEPRVQAIARSLIEKFQDSESIDLMKHFARLLPSRVIGDLIGIPEERQECFLEWTEAMVSLDSDISQAQNVQSPAASIYSEFSQLLEERRSERREDLMSALIDAEVEGRKLTQEELLGFCFLLVVAGNDTTQNLIANGAALLAMYPEQQDMLARNPAQIPQAVEEMVRYETPSQALPRITTQDVTRHGVTIPKGEEVLLIWGAANRDEREFVEPERFNVQRTIKRHLGFGVGVHFCLGANLARLEAKVSFEELLHRFPRYRLDGEPPWLCSSWARAHASVPIRLVG